MAVRTFRKQYATTKRVSMTLLDEDIRGFVAESGIAEGFVLVFVAGVSAGVTVTEAEPGIMTHDLEYLFSTGMGAPFGPGFVDGEPYKHHETWGCDNGASHLRSLLLGPSVTIPFANRELLVGPWQNVVLVECDTRDRQRDVVYQVHGE